MGNIVGILDNTGREVVQYAYDAWGNSKTIVLDETQATVAELNPIRYRGYYYDTETNLYYLNTRYYDPETGRFISQDDVSYLDPENVNGLNLYAYCGNNPVMNVDPSGQFFFTALLIGLTLAGVAIGGKWAYDKASEAGYSGLELLGFTLLGAIGGGLLGAGIGLIASIAAPAILSFMGTTFTLGSFSFGMTAVMITVTGTQILMGTAVAGGLGLLIWYSKNAQRYGSSKIGSNQKYNKMFSDFCRKKKLFDRDKIRRFHDFISKKGYDTWDELLEAWEKLFG